MVEGCLIGALALLAYTIGRVFFDGPAQAPQVGRTMAFAVLSLSQVAHAFNMRSEHSLFSIGFFSNPKLNLAAAVCILLQVSVIAIPAAAALFRAVPLTGAQWAITASLSLSPVLWVELEKRLFRRQKAGKSRAL